MLARLLPQGDDVPIVHELTRMGHQCPAELLHGANRVYVWKLLDIPQTTATAFTTWLQQQTPGSWWYAIAGAQAGTVDLLFACPGLFLTACQNAAVHIPSLQPVLAALEQARQQQEAAPRHLLLGDTSVRLGQRTLVMGIVNVTPDSFSDGGLYLQPEQAVKHAEEMLADGVDIIDVGGQSARPGATPVPEEVEFQRVIPVVRGLVQRYGVPVSVDTYRASIAKAALDAGAVLINDISAMRFDPQMAPLMASRQAAVVLMHMQGTPHTMQLAPTYRHVVDEVYSFLAERLQVALQHGIARQRIILDPGIGFGKTVSHCLELLRSLGNLQALGQPLLVGTSRKSFLGNLLQREVWDRLEGTLASVVYAMLRGAALVRVHDVKAVVQAVRLVDALEQSRHSGEIAPERPLPS